MGQPRIASHYNSERDVNYLPPIDHTLKVLLDSDSPPPPTYRSQPSPAQVQKQTAGNMTGRRSTRAASSLASSVAGSDIGQATPRRSTRNHPVLDGSPLPPPLPALASIPARGSTSYGSSIAALPVDFRRHSPGRDLTATLTDILDTVQENIQATYGYNPNPPRAAGSEVGTRGRVRRAASKAPSASNAPAANNDQAGNDNVSISPAANNTPAAISTPAAGRRRGRGQAPSVMSTPGVNNTISYLSESALYGDATFSEDAVISPPRIIRRAAKPPTDKDDQHIVFEPAVERESLWMQLNAFIGRLLELITSRVGTFITGLSKFAKNLISRWDLVVLVLVVLGVANLFSSSPTDDYLFEDHPAGFGISHQIRQWIPLSVSSPLSYVNDLDLSNLKGRVSVVETELRSLKKNVGLNKEALEKLKSILPEEMYLSKENGEAELPPSFWKALTGKVQKSSSSKDKLETISRSDWDDFLAQNEAKVKAWQAEVSEDYWAQHLREALKDGGVLASKADIVDMIDKRWASSKNLIQIQVRDEIENAAKVFNRPGLITKEEAKDLYNELAMKTFIKNEDAKNIAYYQLQRPNHFSFGLGAVVNPSTTSPTYSFAKARAWWPKRLILWSIGYGIPTPNPPSEALRRWDEAGDCWCSPATGAGAGVQLGVLMANDLFPKEVVIEHIPKAATLDSSSAPREMELLAQINDYQSQGTVGELSEKIFPDFHEPHLGKEWILIGTWRYDMEDENHVQYFYPQIDLQSIGASTRQLIVRAKNNQGSSDHTCLYRVRVHGEVAEKSNA